MTQMAAPARAPRRSIWFLLAFGALQVVPSSASATAAKVEVIGQGSRATVFVGSTNLVNDATPHVVTVSSLGGAYLVTDSAGVAAAAPNCAQVSATLASCANPVGTAVDRVDIYASGGADTITATSLGQTVTSTAVDGNAGDDTITTGPTMDEIRADEGDDILDGGLGADSILGQEGIDTTTYATRTDAVTVSIDSEETPDGTASEGDNTDTENVIGGAGDDTIIGSTQASKGAVDKILNKSEPAGVFTGGAGNDRLSGGFGADRLDGGAGNDRLSGGDGKDKLKGGAGKDRCNGGKSKDRARQCERKAGIP